MGCASRGNAGPLGILVFTCGLGFCSYWHLASAHLQFCLSCLSYPFSRRWVSPRTYLCGGHRRAHARSPRGRRRTGSTPLSANMRRSRFSGRSRRARRSPRLHPSSSRLRRRVLQPKHGPRLRDRHALAVQPPIDTGAATGRSDRAGKNGRPARLGKFVLVPCHVRVEGVPIARDLSTGATVFRVTTPARASVADPASCRNLRA